MAAARVDGFTHEAFFYEGEDGLLGGTLPFVREGLVREEPTLVALNERGIGALRRELGPDAERVRFVDMLALGRNPSRIIPVWREFVADHGGTDRPVRGIGEPVWAGRSDEELTECDRHESLLNLAFAGARGFTLLCPYDTTALAPDVLTAARRNHPVLADPDGREASGEYHDPRSRGDALEGALSEPEAEVETLSFDASRLAAVRALARARARGASLGARRQADLAVAVNELATNSVRHGGGTGVLRIWTEPWKLVCEVADGGWITDPLVGRRRPSPDDWSGRGLWIVNQLCDLVQVRSGADGTTVRIHMDLA